MGVNKERSLRERWACNQKWDDDRSTLREYHPRQWVDRSGTTYRRRRAPASSNPTHGSGWIVQVLPTVGQSHFISPIHCVLMIQTALPGFRL